MARSMRPPQTPNKHQEPGSVPTPDVPVSPGRAMTRQGFSLGQNPGQDSIANSRGGRKTGLFCLRLGRPFQISRFRGGHKTNGRTGSILGLYDPTIVILSLRYFPSHHQIEVHQRGRPREG